MRYEGKISLIGAIVFTIIGGYKYLVLTFLATALIDVLFGKEFEDDK